MSMIRAVDIFYASKLRQLREQCYMKQFAAAQLIGMNQQHYSELESGKKNFTPRIIRDIHCGFVLPNKEGNSLSTLEWFKGSIYQKLTDPQHEGYMIEFISLFYDRESLKEQLREVNDRLNDHWIFLTGEKEYRERESLIKIGYLKPK